MPPPPSTSAVFVMSPPPWPKCSRGAIRRVVDGRLGVREVGDAVPLILAEPIRADEETQVGQRLADRRSLHPGGERVEGACVPANAPRDVGGRGLGFDADRLDPYLRFPLDNLAIDIEITRGHPAHTESFLKNLPAALPAQG